MKGFLKVLVLLLSLSLLLAACGGGKGNEAPKASPAETHAAPTTAPTGGETKAASKEMMTAKMAVGGKGSIIYLPPAIAEYKGFFKEEGIDIQVSDVKGGSQAIQALVSGEVDWGSAAIEHVIKYQAQGVDLVMVGLYTRYPAITLVVSSELKDKVKTVNDLKGMKVGVTSPNSATHKALLTLMNKHGMKPSDVEVLGVGTSGLVDAIKSGKVQAGFGLDPFVTDLVSSGNAFILWDLRTQKDTVALYEKREVPFVGMVTRREVLEKNPELAQRMVNALVKANKFITSSMPEEIAAVLPAELKGVSEPLYVASLKANMEAFPSDALAIEEGVQLVIDTLKAEKVIPESAQISPSSVFDGSWAKKAG
ncbi:MAG: ABC transporter substrate-binding protein [Bacillota bacterium]